MLKNNSCSFTMNCHTGSRLVGVVFITLLLVSLGYGVEVKASDFIDIKPTSTRYTNSVEWGGITCAFSYVSMGGTNEQWEMTLTEEHDGEYTCDVLRPEGVSYLYFQEFLLEVTGAELSTAVIFTESKEKQAGTGEYTIDYQKKTVKNGPSFKNNLNSVRAVILKDTKQDNRKQKRLDKKLKETKGDKKQEL